MASNEWSSVEQQHQFVGRMRAVEESIKAVLAELPNHERHAFDLLIVSRDSFHRATMLLWGKAPEMQADQTSTTPEIAGGN